MINRDDIKALMAHIPSTVKGRIIDAGDDIKTIPPEDISYQHTVLCQTGLPYRATTERRWEAQNGRIMLEVEAGRVYEPKRGWKDMSLPFGPRARLILIYINSEAIKNQHPVIDVGNSMTGFIKSLQGREPNGREVSTFKTQMAALAAATIRFAMVGEETAEAVQSLNSQIKIAKKFDLWFSKNAKQRVLWTSSIELSDDYFNTLIHHAVPLDQRAIGALAHSAMALDIYAWLAQRLCRVKGTGIVPWSSLHGQFGHGYGSIRKFRQVFLHTLTEIVHPVYPDARFDHNPAGLIIRNSPPPIHRKIHGQFGTPRIGQD